MDQVYGGTGTIPPRLRNKAQEAIQKYDETRQKTLEYLKTVKNANKKQLIMNKIKYLDSHKKEILTILAIGTVATTGTVALLSLLTAGLLAGATALLFIIAKRPEKDGDTTHPWSSGRTEEQLKASTTSSGTTSEGKGLEEIISSWESKTRKLEKKTAEDEHELKMKELAENCIMLVKIDLRLVNKKPSPEETKILFENIYKGINNCKIYKYLNDSQIRGIKNLETRINETNFDNEKDFNELKAHFNKVLENIIKSLST